MLLGSVAAAVAMDQSPAELAPKVLVRVTLVPAAAGTAGEGYVVFRRASAASPVVVPARMPGFATAELPVGSQWTVVADVPGSFSYPSVLQVPLDSRSGPVEIDVSLRPAGTLTGKLVVKENDKLPEGLEARFEPTREAGSAKQGIPAGLAPCAVSPEGDWRCRVPAGRLDVALHPKGFVPVYLWNVDVKAGETSNLGPKGLLRGASVSGWVVREDGTPAEECRVRLEPETAPGRPNDPALEFLRSVASDIPCQKKGFFQFSAVAAGSYALVAQAGKARAHMSPVEVWEGSESRLTEPLRLRHPLDFELTLTPALDWLGRPWRVEARRASDHRAGWEEPSYRAEASTEGHLRIPDQVPGRFWITVYDGLGNAIFSDSYVELVDSTPFSIALDLLWVDGTVTLGGEPVQGRLFFGGRSGETSIQMASDEDGRFQGPLPKAGEWRVDVSAEEPRLKATAKVTVKPKAGRATVSIELPDTRVHGRVVDGAVVALGSTLGTLSTETDSKGVFELRGFPAGSLEISAERAAGRGRREVSDISVVEAAEDSPQGPFVLALRRNQTFRGRVLAATGPSIGATVSAWPATGGNGAVSTVRTRLDGSFELELPESTQVVQVVVSPPGGALKAYEMTVLKEAEILLQIEPQGGELRIDFAKGRSMADGILAVWQGDLALPLGTLVRWAEGHAVRFHAHGQVRIPQLAPGTYTVCQGAPAVVAPGELETWKKGSAACASGYLGAGAELALRLE